MEIILKSSLRLYITGENIKKNINYFHYKQNIGYL